MSLSVYGRGPSANSLRIIMAADRLVWFAKRSRTAQRRGRGRTDRKRLESAVLITFVWLLQLSIVYRLFFLAKPIFQKLHEPLKVP